MAKSTRRGPGRPRILPEDKEKEIIINESPSSLRMSQQKQISVDDVKKSLTNLFAETIKKNPELSSVYTSLNELNPFIQNSRLKTISSFPENFPPAEINNALMHPQYHERLLRSAGWALSSTQYLYYKILRESADVPLFHHFFTPPSLKKEEYTKNSFLEEEEFVEDWVQKFDVSNTLKRIALEVKREGKSTYVFRQCINNKGGKRKTQYATWQKLPTNWTKLTGIGQYGYTASFNMMIFLNPAFSPNQYPEYIRDIWNELVSLRIIVPTGTNKEKIVGGVNSPIIEGERGVGNVRPFSKLSGKIIKNKKNDDYINIKELNRFSYNYKKQDGTSSTVRGTLEIAKDSYMYWVPLPQELCFTFASDTSNAWVAPDTMGLFSGLQELTDYGTLAGLITSTPLTAVLTGEAEPATAPQPGQDQFILNPKTMLSFQNLFNSMASSNIQAFLAPFKNLKLQSLPNIPNASDIKTKAVQNFISTAGEGGLIPATDKPSVAMVKGTQLLIESQYDFVTRQFESILNMIIEKWLGLKNQWRLHLWGGVYSFDATMKRLKESVAGGTSYLLPKLASADGYSMRDVRAVNNYLEALGIVVKETKEGEAPVGRPSLEDGEVENDNTAASKDAGTNVSDIKEFVQNNVCFICGEMTEDGHIICESCESEFGQEENE